MLDIDEDAPVSIEDQAGMLVDAIGTEREWCGIGIRDGEGFAEVVALAHPNNARWIRHCCNNFDELVEVLDDAAHSLEAAAIALKESPAQHFYILQAKKMWKVIEKAKEVKT